jgi:uncharacterized SAM-binding protein YcdF (DUF218 family)
VAKASPPEAKTKPRLRRPVLLAVLGALLIGVGYVGITFLQVWNTSRADDARPAEAIVVLGAAQYSGTPSPALAGRLDHALALYDEGLAPLIVVTGGGQEGDITTEAKTGYDYLRDRGVPDEAILLEVDGTSTYESLRAAKRFLEPRDVDDVILVSDPSHSHRSRDIAEEVGLVAVVSPTGASTTWSQLVRETGAVAVGQLISYRRLDGWAS